MLRKILKKLRLGQLLKQNYGKESPGEQNLEKSGLSLNLADNLVLLRNIFGKNADFVLREFNFGEEEKMQAALLYFDGLVDKRIVNESVIRPLMYDSRFFAPRELKRAQKMEYLQEKMVAVGGVKVVTTIDELLDNCLYGDTILLIDGFAEALSLNTKGWVNRGVEEPKTEAVVRGPREGFTETLGLNTSLLRRKICHPDLIIEGVQLGEKTKTKVCLAYLKGVVSADLLKEVKTRLQRIETDAILESGYLEEFIEDAPYSPFATVANSERPDNVAAKILEGRVAILVDGTPMVLTVPMLLAESFQSPEDYYSRPYYVSFVRTLRYLSFFITITAPAIYVALTTFHQELLPTPLLMTMAAAREGTPFPALVEAIIMMIIFEILREAGIRLPRPIGSAISIVGALVIGEAAVSAGLVGAPMIIVISLTAIASFVVSAQADAATILRLFLMIVTGFMGAFGFFVFLLALLIHLAALRSFGVPYFAPFAPLNLQGLKDTIIRVPMWAMLTRPQLNNHNNRKRVKFGLIPRPPRKET